MADRANVDTKPMRRMAMQALLQKCPPGTRRHRVLVVAAHPWERLAVVDDLLDGCEVLSVGSYSAALGVLVDRDLVCSMVSYLDLGDGPDGVDLMDAARLRSPSTSVVLIADPPVSADQAARFVRARRAHQTLISPWNHGNVLAAVCAACDACSAHVVSSRTENS